MLKGILAKVGMLTACVCMILAMNGTADAAGIAAVSASTADQTVSVAIADSSWYGREMSVVCYAPGYTGAVNDLKNGIDSIVYLDQIKAAASVSFKIYKKPEAGVYRLVLGCNGAKVEEQFSFTDSTPVVNAEAKLAAPSGVKAAQTAATTVKVTWADVGQAVSYDIYRSVQAQKNFKKIGSAKSESYADKKAVAGKTNYYKIVAVHTKEQLNSDMSDAAKAAVLGAPKASAKAGKKKVTVTWKKVSGAAGYKIYVSAKKKGGFKVSATIKGKAKTKGVVRKLKSGKTYNIKVAAYKKSGKKIIIGKASKVVRVKVK